MTITVFLPLNLPLEIFEDDNASFSFRADADGEGSFDYSIDFRSGSATDGQDYVAFDNEGTIEFPDGVNSDFFSTDLVALMDEADEETETLDLRVTLTGAEFADGSRRKTFEIAIHDDVDLHGTDGDDKISGSDINDIIHGYQGNDTLKGLAGNDTIYGGDDDDMLFGGGAFDIVDGGRGRDEIDGGSGGDGISGGRGYDSILGGSGADTISGGDGEDTIRAQEGNDYLEGNDGRDRLNGGRGTDTVAGGSGRDTFVFRPDNFRDTIVDFKDDADQIDLKSWGFSSVDAVLDQGDRSGGNVTFDFGDGDVLVVENTSLGKLEDDLLI